MHSKFDPKKHHRRSIRLKGYDYSQPGAYYVTIVVWHREFLFGEVVKREMVLSNFGLVAKQQWEKLPGRFPNIELGAFVIMPNHMHGIIVITNGRARRRIEMIMTVNRPAVSLRVKDSKNL